jgi:O-antigen ligase
MPLGAKREVPIEQFYALKLGPILRHMGREHFSFWMICCYFFFEYVRPQSIITSIDVLPWATVFLALTLLGRVLDRRAKWVSDSTNLWMTAFMLIILAASINAIYPDWSWRFFKDMLSWYVVYFLIINVVTTEKRLLIFLAIFLLSSFKLSFFGARTWAMRGFSFESWGLQGPPGFFMNSGELTVQMLMYAPVAYYFAMFLRPHISRLKFFVMMLMPTTAVLTILGASSRGSQLGLLYQLYRVLLKGRLSVKTLVVVGAVAYGAWALLPTQQKERFSSAGDDNTSQQRLLYWEHGIEMIREYPILGVGYFNFPPYYYEHFRHDLHVPKPQLPHNILIQVGTDAGLLGLFAFGMLLYRNAKLARDVRKMGMEDKPYGAIAQGLLIAMWGFVIAGQFVTVTYYPFIWINLAFAVCLHNVASQTQRERAALRSQQQDTRAEVQGAALQRPPLPQPRSG